MPANYVSFSFMVQNRLPIKHKIGLKTTKNEKFFSKLLAQTKKVVFLPRNSQAEIAQLVEHDLAKVGVASSSLVFRSKLGGVSGAARAEANEV